MIQQSPTPRNVLSHYQDMLRNAKNGAIVTVPPECVTLVTRMAHTLFIEKGLKVKAEAAAALPQEMK